MDVVVLVDGEHYPPVVSSAIEELKKTHNVLAAIFLGGTEKIKIGQDISKVFAVPVYKSGDYISDIRAAVDRHKPEAAIDLSDEPVVNYDDRFKIASELALLGVDYVGADFRFTAIKYQKIFTKPSLSVIGTGKRIGKTAVAGYICRLLKNEGFNPVAVTMGRGGPGHPEVIEGDKIEITPSYLVSESLHGKHASSDHYEDALTSRIRTIGCRRCGGGMMGQPYSSVVVEGCRLAESLENDYVVLEGSGASFAPVETDHFVTVAGCNQKTEHLLGFFGRYRLKKADLVVLTHCEEPIASKAKIDDVYFGVKKINPGAKVFKTVFRPKPLGDIKGKKVIYTSALADEMVGKISEYIGCEFGCTIVSASNKLSNRPLLMKDLSSMEKADVLLTELKASAVDVATKYALEKGMEVVYCDNIPICDEGSLDEAVRCLIKG
ncbi:MAG: 2,3-diphosphoglycerate synthetase [Candidatus Altiarchaeota archaeon]|nr:2,3-diphosphoglycerate synthetase [Candidatus Altiarchaeota archaeon]